MASVPTGAADGKLGGCMFADYYYVASGTAEKQNGFLFRRIYLTYSLKWDEHFSGRVRLEANDAGFGKSDKMEPFVKHAYMRYRKRGRAVYAGLCSTPTWSVSEKAWGYRSIEKTVMDLRKIGSSADLGVAFDVRLGETDRASARVMLGNGNGQKPEGDNGKKIYALLHVKPAGALSVTVGADWEDKPDDMNRTTLAAFVGTAGKAFHGGVEGFVRVYRNQHAGEDVQVRGVSAFGAMKASARAKVFGRLDYFDPSSKAAEDGEYLAIAGLDLMPIPDIHVMPNVVATAFQAPGRDTQVIPRITLFLRF